MTTFYIGTSFEQKEKQRAVAKLLIEKCGWEQTYDWTQSTWDAAPNDPADRDVWATNIGEAESDAVMDADHVLILLPGGKGTHTELGIALGMSMVRIAPRVGIFGTEEDFAVKPGNPPFYRCCARYEHNGTIEGLLDAVLIYVEQHS